MIASREYVKDLISKVLRKYYNDNYSKDELRIGTWINGKPLYRKTIEFNITKTGTNISSGVSLSGLNIDAITKVEGIGLRSDGGTVVTPHYESSSYYFMIKAGPTYINYNFNWSGLSNFTKAQVTLYYTKTTD